MKCDLAPVLAGGVCLLPLCRAERNQNREGDCGSDRSLYDRRPVSKKSEPAPSTTPYGLQLGTARRTPLRLSPCLTRGVDPKACQGVIPAKRCKHRDLPHASEFSKPATLNVERNGRTDEQRRRSPRSCAFRFFATY